MLLSHHVQDTRRVFSLSVRWTSHEFIFDRFVFFISWFSGPSAFDLKKTELSFIFPTMTSIDAGTIVCRGCGAQGHWKKICSECLAEEKESDMAVMQANITRCLARPLGKLHGCQPTIDASNIVCRGCGAKGHWKKRCPERLAEEKESVRAIMQTNIAQILARNEPLDELHGSQPMPEFGSHQKKEDLSVINVVCCSKLCSFSQSKSI